MGYSAAAWLGFGEALAAVAGALTGLLFVAVSIKSELLARSRSLAWLGSELLAVAVISAVILAVLDRRAARDSGGAGHEAAEASRAAGDRVARYVRQYSPNLITTLLVGVASAWLFLVKLTG